MNERDACFQEFATMLWREILQSSTIGDVLGHVRVFTEEQAEDMKRLIARHAFELVAHCARRDIVRLLFEIPPWVLGDVSDSNKGMESHRKSPLEEQ